MAARYLYPRLAAVLLSGFVGGGFQTTARAEELSLSTAVPFSELDGGFFDEDGTSDGVLTLDSLVLLLGTIILDVPEAEFDIKEEMRLGGSSAIRSPSKLPAFGTRVTIRVGKTVEMRGSASISAAGSSAAGDIFICAPGGIELHGNSSISSNGSSSAGGDGGTIWLQSNGEIELVDDSTLISADGANGGTVILISCDSGDHAIEIDGLVTAVGSAGAGGRIRMEARKSGIELEDGSPRLIATGFAGDGTIQLTVATDVTPNPPPSDPAAEVTTDHPSSEPCEDCHFATEGDCDANGVPDEEDLATCGSDPDCDDCNLNEVLDECDIESGVSLDVNPMDGIPDECQGFVAGGCFPPSANWSCFDNWTLPDDQYPDDINGARGVHVTLGPGDAPFLDLDVTIPALRLLLGSTLLINQLGLDGDLDFSPPAKVLNQGTILIADLRTIGGDSAIPPMFTIGAGGVFQKADAATAGSVSGESLTTATLRVTDLIIQAGSCASPAADGGVLRLEEAMSLNANGRVILEGAAEAECDAGSVARGGVSPPPKLDAGGSTKIKLGGDVIASRDGTAGGDPEPPAGTLSFSRVVEISVRSDTAVVIKGDFDNKGTAPALFDWLSGGLDLDGTEPQKFEVAGLDLGAVLAGFDTGLDSNFSMGSIRIGPTTNVTFVNQFANVLSNEACAEALYVRELVFEPGSVVTLDNCRVYYRTLQANGVTPTLLGCAALVPIPFASPSAGDNTCHLGAANLGVSCSTHDDCTGLGVCGLKSRYLTIRPPTSFFVGVEEPTSIRVEVVSLPNGAGRTGEIWWVGPEQAIPNSPLPALRGAPLECTAQPHVQVWTSGDLHLWGAIVVPGARYAVRTCDPTGTNCSTPIIADTGQWGNVVKPFDGGGEPNFADVSAIAEKFRNLASAPITSRVDLDPAIPNGNINFLDISYSAEAFRGLPYPFPLPAVCP